RTRGARQRSKEETGESRLIDQRRHPRHPANFTADELDLQPVLAVEPKPGFDAAVERRVVTRRILRTVAGAQAYTVLLHHHDGMPAIKLFVPLNDGKPG